MPPNQTRNHQLVRSMNTRCAPLRASSSQQARERVTQPSKVASHESALAKSHRHPLFLGFAALLALWGCNDPTAFAVKTVYHAADHMSTLHPGQRLAVNDAIAAEPCLPTSCRFNGPEVDGLSMDTLPRDTSIAVLRIEMRPTMPSFVQTKIELAEVKLLAGHLGRADDAGDHIHIVCWLRNGNPE